MALQTAPLGQLSGLNLPYSIPTYEKPKSILQQALAAALVGAATNAGRNVAENVTSRDYATEADGGPAKGFSRLLGPKVDARANQQRQAYAHDAEMQQSGQNFTAAQNEYNRSADTNRDFFRGEREKELQKERLIAQQAAVDREATLAMARQQRETDNRRHEQVVGAGQQAARDASQASLRANDPLNLAETRKSNAEASRLERFLTGSAMGSQGQVQGQPQVDASPAVKAYAQPQTAPTEPQVQLSPEEAMQALQAMLAPKQVNTGEITPVQEDPQTQLQAIIQALGTTPQPTRF